MKPLVFGRNYEYKEGSHLKVYNTSTADPKQAFPTDDVTPIPNSVILTRSELEELVTKAIEQYNIGSNRKKSAQQYISSITNKQS